MTIKPDDIKDLSPDEILTLILVELQARRISPKIAKAIANRLFLKGHINVDGHGIIMNGIHRRR